MALDVIPQGRPPRTLGIRVMQSRWLARVYESFWRPLAFGLTTRFTAPSAAREARLVVDRIAGCAGPWLDLSCGTGLVTRALVAHSPRRTVFGVDLSRAMLERARAAAPKAILVHADAAELPFHDGVFGAVVNVAALDLYLEPDRVLAEATRVLARGGRWVCSTFVSEDGPPRWLARLSGTRAPTLAELASMAARAGLAGFDSQRFHRYVLAWADRA